MNAPQHIPRHRLEELLVERTADPRAQAHLEDCEHCRARLSDLGAERAAYLARNPTDSLLRAVAARELSEPGAAPAPGSGGRKRARSGFIVAGAVALAAAAALAVWPQAQQTEVRYKGAAMLEVHVKRGERTRQVHYGDSLWPGDQVGFLYTLDQPRHLLLLSIDDKGEVSRYFPAAPRGPQQLPAGQRVQLPVAVQLDDHKGQERLIAFFARVSLDETAVRRALAEAHAQARAAGNRLPALPIPGVDATQVGLRVDKP